MGLILAAGTSSRLGRPKQLLELAGRPVLQHVLDAAEEAGLDRIALVLGHAGPEIAAAVSLPPGTSVVTNPEYARGQSTSLQAGLRSAGPDVGAMVVLLGDQPGVGPRAIGAVVERWRTHGGAVVQASYGGHPAHPTLFDRSVWAELERTGGDEGARSVLARHPEWLSPVEVGGQPPPDIDTEEDYDRIRRGFEGP